MSSTVQARRLLSLLVGLFTIALVVGLPPGSANAASTTSRTSNERAIQTLSSAAPTASSGGYTRVTPQRLLDTRSNGATRRPSGSVTSVAVLGRAGLPATPVAAIVANVTAVSPAADGWVIAYPSQSTRPNASTLNFIADRTTPNRAVLPVGADGKILLYTSATTHLLLDVVGYYPAGGYFSRTAPTRLADTRVSGGMFQAGETRRVRVTGRAGIPLSGVTAVAVNVAAVTPRDSGALSTTRTFSTTTPPEQNLYAPGRNHASLIIAQVLPDGDIVVRSTGRTHVIVDVTGWLSSGGDFVARDTARSDPSMWVPETSTRQPAGTTRVFRPTGRDENTALIPGVGVNAVEVTVVVMFPRSDGYVTLFPTGQPRPTVSTANYALRDNSTAPVTSNTATVSLGTDGTFSVYTSGDAEIHIVTGGYHTGVIGRPTSTTGPAFAPQLYFPSISCPAENFCLASAGDGHVYSWNGITWTRSAVAFPEGAVPVSCGSPTTCAVATSAGDVWTSVGGTWRKSNPFGTVLWTGPAAQLDCVSATFCLFAVGRSVATFDGTTWKTLTVPSSIARSGVSSAACSSATLCMIHGGGDAYALRNGVWDRISGFGFPATCSGAGFCTSPQGNYDPLESTYWRVATTSRSFFSYVPPAPAPLVSVSGAECTPGGRCVVYYADSVAVTNLAAWGQPVAVGSNIAALSCPSDRVCMGLDTDNRIVTIRL